MYDILDFNAVTKHSYYGQKNRTSDTLICEATGEEVVNWHAAVNDFLSRYMDIIDNPRFLLVAHDMGTVYRKSFFPEYKANRGKRVIPSLEREMIAKTQDWVKKFLTAIGATQIGVQGVEADDVIAWLVGGQDVSAIVHTVDADMLQLVADNCVVSLKGEHHYAGGTFKDIPYYLTSFSKSVLGDTSDGYKGIPGIGPAKFIEFMELVGDDNCLQMSDFLQENNLTAAEQLMAPYMENKVVQKLMENWSEWLNQYRLARLHPELCWKPYGGKLTKPTIHKRIPNAQRVFDLLKEVGAEDLYESKYKAMLPGTLLVSSDNWVQVKDVIKEQMLKGDIVAYDYETSDKNPKTRFQRAATRGSFVDNLAQEITGISFCFGEFNQNVIYLTVDHKDSPNLTHEEVKDLLIFMARNSDKIVPVAHNAFFEGTVTQAQLNIAFGRVQDTRIMQRYYDENSSAGLKDMSLQYLGYNQATYEETLEAASVAKMCDLTWQQAINYGADDALVTAHLYDIMKLMLKLDGSWMFYQQWAVEPTQVLQSAYLKGVRINWPLQKRLHEKDQKTVEDSLAALRDILQKNVTGQVTKGCESLLEVSKQFIERSTRDRFPDDWQQRVRDWEHKLRTACNYQPYMESEVIPAFAYTAKQVSDAAVAVGLPAIEKLTLSAIQEYFNDLGLNLYEAPVYEGDQKQFIDLFQEAFAQRIDKLGKEFTEERQEAFDKFGAFCQKVSGVEPRIIKTGDELNLNSSAQMQELIYCKIGVPVRLFGKASVNRLKLGVREGSPSTDEKAVETALAFDAEGWQVEALNLLLKAKSALTRITLFHNKMPLWVHDDGRIHPFITDAGTDTRRPTGSSPNILQISARGEGGVMREMYMPPSEDYVCIATDFSGQELRIMASESGDPQMIEAYTPGNEKDIHSMTGVGIARMRSGKNPDLVPITEFEEFEKARKLEDHPLHKLAEAIRGHAKACIAEGQLVLTDSGLVPIEKVTLQHKVWDGIEFVNHEGVVYKGKRQVLTYGPLQATPDHPVYLRDGSKTDFSDICNNMMWTELMHGGIGTDTTQEYAIKFSKEYGRDATHSDLMRRVCAVGSAKKYNHRESVEVMADVYDIINAGPRNRFTVSGIVVSNCNFGLSYGAAAPTIGRNLIIPLEEAEELMDGTLALYYRIPQWQEETAKFMTQNGFTITAWGTKRHATEDLFSKERGKVSRMHRQGINAVIQGAAAESLRTILTKLHTEGWIYKLRMEFFAPIYDEIVSWVHKDDVVEYCKVIKRLMEEATPPGHVIPQVPEFSIGYSWGTCHELGQAPSEERIIKAVEVSLEEGKSVWETDMQMTYQEVFGCEPEEFGLEAL